MTEILPLAMKARQSQQQQQWSTEMVNGNPCCFSDHGFNLHVQLLAIRCLQVPPSSHAPHELLLLLVRSYIIAFIFAVGACVPVLNSIPFPLA